MSGHPHRWSTVCPAPTGLVAPVRVDPTGVAGPTRSQAAGDQWRQVSRGLYVPAWVDGHRPEQRILERAARLRTGGVTGWAANRMMGATFCDGLAGGGRIELPVPLNCGPTEQLCSLPGDSVHRDYLHPPEVQRWHGVRCAPNPRATFDAMRLAPGLRAATTAFDVAAAARLTSLQRMWAYVERHPAKTGVQQVRDALTIGDENSWSPQETRVRLIWVLDAGLPRPLTNRPVFDRAGRLLGYPDLLDPVAGVVGEYDGEDHRDAERHSDDVRREGQLRDHGLEVVRFTAVDTRDRLLVMARLRDAYRRAGWQPAERRTWTLTPPSWWPVGQTLDQILDARDAEPADAAAREPLLLSRW